MKILKSVDENFVELDLQKEAETEKAILFSDGTNKAWIPKSQLEDDPENLQGDLVRIVIPEWLAINKDFV